MKLLLDTHFLIWIVCESKRLRDYKWIKKHLPWGISPISFLEIQFLGDIGRLKVCSTELLETLRSDGRFLIDEVPPMEWIRAALPLTWARDPFDRMLCAHSLARRLPLCSADDRILRNHRLICRELRPK